VPIEIRPLVELVETYGLLEVETDEQVVDSELKLVGEETQINDPVRLLPVEIYFVGLHAVDCLR